MTSRQGFSLVELSIVLVILGLLTGGILGGRSLIKAAELRSVTTEFNQWQTAINTFKQRYMAIPGDFDKAGDFWGYANTAGAGGSCAAPASNTGTGTQTCDGTGNGTLDQVYETYRFWQHLANAGLIQGEYMGVTGSGSVSESLIGENIPASKFSSGGWGARYFAVYAGLDGFYFAYDYGHMLQIGAEWAGTVAHAPIFTPEEAWNIDTKMDDGAPQKGKILANPGGPNCTTTGNESGDNGDISASGYNLSETSMQCLLNFVKVF